MNNHPSPLSRFIRFCLEQKLLVLLFAASAIIAGVAVAPFDWDLAGFSRHPVAVDAIPDIGENQQIVFTEWPGRSPQDVDDQITYPLTTALLGLPHVKSIRSQSMFGFSTIFVIFDEDAEFYWSRTRILEKLNSLPAGTLPQGVAPSLGPDATALGQIFWYTLEGRDENGEPAGGWDLHELRSIQDWIVRFALMSAEGVAEVASIGGHVREYQIDVDPRAMRHYDVTLDQVFSAVRDSNVDVGARTIEVNKVEYVVRGLGLIENIDDVRQIAVASRNDVPVRIDEIAHVTLGPTLRRGALDKAGAEAVGGVVVARFGENPLQTIKNVKAKIEQIQPGLPTKTLDDGTVSQITIDPFYDRTGLVHETLDTLNDALTQQILVAVIVIVLMVMHLRASALICSMLPLAVLMTFIAMKVVGVTANIVALSGVAIAVGTIVDMGIVLSENILRRLDEAPTDEPRLDTIHRASAEVGGAVLTASLTTIVSFLPVFALQAAEGKLFRPLAFTKTFVLIASVVIALTILPPMAHIFFARGISRRLPRLIVSLLAVGLGAWIAIEAHMLGGLMIAAFGAIYGLLDWLPDRASRALRWSANLAVVLIVGAMLARVWSPLGPERNLFDNVIFVGAGVGSLLVIFLLFFWAYPALLRWTLRNKLATLTPIAAIVALGATVWLGFDRVFGWLPEPARSSETSAALRDAFPGLGREFMPALDEGSFLYMPTTMPHASITEALDTLEKIDMAIASLPEVDQVVGKLGRAETPIDPAPISMVETIIQYKPEYRLDDAGRRTHYRVDPETGRFARDEAGRLIPDPNGKPYRQWRDHIESPDDIWNEIIESAKMPGTTSAPKLQPIQTRLIMLQSGFRAPMGVKVFGPDLETIESFALELEQVLKDVPSIDPATVFADRVVGKPYLEIDIDRERIARYGMAVGDVQRIIEVAVGGTRLTTTVEGRERYPVRVRYMRELRDRIETLGEILIPAPDGRQIPLQELAEIRYVRGPQMIKSENTFLVAYVIFDKKPRRAEVNVVNDARRRIEQRIDRGELIVPAGVSFEFAGSYENQVRAAQRLRLIIPAALVVVFVLLYLQFRSTVTSLIVFSAVLLAWSGGFALLWLYAQPWFLDVSLLGVNLRELFNIHTINLSVAVWVGFLALFGIATDNAVVLATLLRQTFDREQPRSIEPVRAATVEASRRRVRPCLMTTATTMLALLPVLASEGKGSDIMAPMAVPIFGGMLVALLSLFLAPVLYCAWREWRLRAGYD